MTAFVEDGSASRTIEKIKVGKMPHATERHTFPEGSIATISPTFMILVIGTKYEVRTVSNDRFYVLLYT